MSDHPLEHSRAYLAAIIESSDDAILSKDLDGVIRSFNAAAERLFGWTAEEIIGRPVTVLLPPDRLPEESEILARLRRGERIEHFETERITKDGRRLDISLSVSPVRDGAGVIVGAAKIARDITERKRAARALAAQQEWFRVTLGSIGDAVIASDPAGRVTFLNPVAEKLTGWTSAEASGQPFHEVFHIVHEQTGVRVENPADRVLREGITVGLANHTVLVSRDGTAWPIDDSAAPILDDAGRILGVVLVFRDVTERRRVERERLAAAQEREDLLGRERRARADAEHANRVKDDFVAMVSHELRTPLSAILGWATVLHAKLDDPATLRHGLEIIDRNARAQAQLVSDLLDVSRIASDKLVLELQRVDLRSLVAESIEAVEHVALEREVTITSRVEGEIAPTVGDPARLKQVIWNLLTNAAKFSPKGGRVEVTLRGRETHAQITVRDFGIGIAPADLGQLFERFRQLGSTSTRGYGGLGLGLSISKHLVELHGGTLRAASEGEGKGATFTVDLPLAQPVPERTPAGPETGAASTAPSLAGLTVLVVEDEPDMRHMIRLVLESHGAEVRPAASAHEALQELERRPDLLVSDIRLQGMDGYELMRRIRAREDAAARIPAVALTAFARSEDRSRAMAAGFQAHLAKPFDPAELVLTVASFGGLLRGAGARAATLTRGEPV